MWASHGPQHSRRSPFWAVQETHRRPCRLRLPTQRRPSNGLPGSPV